MITVTEKAKTRIKDLKVEVKVLQDDVVVLTNKVNSLKKIWISSSFTKMAHLIQLIYQIVVDIQVIFLMVIAMR
jgi:hypothetical protein